MSPLLKTFLLIALRKRGPDALPASQFLLMAAVVGYVLAGIGLLLLSSYSWEVRISLLVMSPLFLASFTLIVLRIESKHERAVQTLSALFGIAILFTLLELPVQLAILEFLPSTAAGEVTGAVPLSPVLLALGLIDLALLFWQIAALSWVYQRALGKDAIYGTGIAVIYYLVDVLMSQSLVS